MKAYRRSTERRMKLSPFAKGIFTSCQPAWRDFRVCVSCDLTPQCMNMCAVDQKKGVSKTAYTYTLRLI